MSPSDPGWASPVRHGTATDPGRVREGNEDTLLADPGLGLYVVADGLGGHQAGEVASSLAVELIRAWVRQPPDGATEPGEVLARALDHGHEGVREASAARPELAGMGTTAVVAWIVAPDRLWLANVGDSRGYRLRDGALEQLTVDDTLLEELRRAGALAEDPARWPARSQLTQALGPSPAVTPHVGSHELLPGDRYLLCSDGLTDMLTNPEIRYLVSATPDPQLACDALVDAANRHGGLDNITVVALDARPAGPGNDS